MREATAEDMPGPPTYRERLRVEGGVLAACGAAGSVALLVAVDESTRNPASTIGQLAAVAALLGWLGPRGARRSMDAAGPAAAEEGPLSGEPTPLWQLPLIVAGLAVPIGLVGGWDAGLRVTGGCLLVGLAQAVLIERVVAARERAGGGAFVRLAGSRILRGTRLGRL